MNMDTVKNADYKGMLDKATAFVRRMNDRYDAFKEPWRSVGTFVLGAVVVGVTSGLLTWVLLGGVVGVRLWGTLKRF